MLALRRSKLARLRAPETRVALGSTGIPLQQLVKGVGSQDLGLQTYSRLQESRALIFIETKVAQVTRRTLKAAFHYYSQLQTWSQAGRKHVESQLRTCLKQVFFYIPFV